MAMESAARDPLKALRGSLDATSRDETRRNVRGSQAVRAVDNEEEDGAGLFPRRIKKAEIVYATSQIALMVDTGINLASALGGVAEGEQNPSLKALLLELKGNVESGEDFSVALARHPKQFDQTYLSLVKASEQTGLLAEMLDRIAEYMQKEMQTKSKVRGAMAYPGVMLVLAIGVTIFLLTFVLPKFQPLFDAKGKSLPTATLVLMHASHALMHHWYLWLLGIGAAIGGFLYARTTPGGKKVIDWAKVNAPVIGPVMRKVIISRSLRTLGTLLESGVSVLESLRLTAEVSGNALYRQLWLDVVDKVTNGNQICESLAGNPLLPPTVVQMVGSGEETGKLDTVLNRLSRHFDLEVDQSIKTATSLIEPLMITVMGVVVGGIALGLLMPIFSLSRPG